MPVVFGPVKLDFGPFGATAACHQRPTVYRDEKRTANFLVFATLAAIRFWLRVDGFGANDMWVGFHVNVNLCPCGREPR